MSKVVSATKQLEAQLRQDGYKGTQRVMRLMKSLRAALESAGYSFEEAPEDKSTRRTSKSDSL